MTTPEKAPEADGRLLFCPFCRECYEGETECPVHELELVEFQDLPRQQHEHDLPGWEEPVDPWDVRFGRGWLALGALALVVGFFLPLATGTFEDTTTTWTGYQLAIGRAGNLWTVPFVAAMFVYFLLRRRTPIQMMGSRLVALVLSVAPLLSLGYSIMKMRQGVARAHGALGLDYEPGVVVIAAGCLLLLVGSLRFGVLPSSEIAPHGSSPDEDPDRGIERD